MNDRIKEIAIGAGLKLKSRRPWNKQINSNLDRFNMSILCKLFGHTPAKGWGGPQYGEVWGGTVDGIGREHLYLKYRCRRCPKPIYLNIHAPERK